MWYQLSVESFDKNLALEKGTGLVERAIDACDSANEVYVSNIIRLLYFESLVDVKPLQVIKESEAIVYELNDLGKEILLPGYYALLAKAYLNIGKNLESESYAKEALIFDNSPGATKSTITAYWVLYRIYYIQGLYESSLNYYVKYSERNSIYLNDLEARNYSVRLAEHKIKEIERENKSLADQNDLLKLEQQLTQSEKENQQLFIVLLATCLVLLAAYLYKARQNQLRLKQLAEFDALTGVYNRGHFTQLAKSALTFAKDSKQSASVVLFDLDLFKKINDTYGHACGDWVLKQVAAACQELTRKNDVFARVGGEEFCFLLLGCDSHTALDVAEKCRRAINNIDTKESGFDFKVSGSFGVSDNALSGYELDRILADADEALYCSKSSGRNTVSLYDPSAEHTSLLKPDDSPAPLG
nr:GGDEF domain-containing protein [Neiella litorisoli]